MEKEKRMYEKIGIKESLLKLGNTIKREDYKVIEFGVTAHALKRYNERYRVFNGLTPKVATIKWINYIVNKRLGKAYVDISLDKKDDPLKLCTYGEWFLRIQDLKNPNGEFRVAFDIELQTWIFITYVDYRIDNETPWLDTYDKYIGKYSGNAYKKDFIEERKDAKAKKETEMILKGWTY